MSLLTGDPMGEKAISPRFDALIDAVASGDAPFRLGLFGGTFDPVHIGHLHIAARAREQFALDGVLFIPTGRPVRKLASGFSDAEDRHAMLKAAVAGNARFDVSRVETRRAGVTYTIDTLRAIHERYGEKARLFLIVGSDAAADLGTWKDAERIAELVTVLSAEREALPGDCTGLPGGEALSDGEHLSAHTADCADASALAVVSEEHLPTCTAGRFDVRPIDSCLIGISSCELREWVRQGRSIQYLVPDATYAYIREQGLYRGVAGSQGNQSSQGAQNILGGQSDHATAGVPTDRGGQGQDA